MCLFRKRYTRAFVLRLPLHRALPIALWFLLSRLLGWAHPVQPVRARVLRECNREGLPGMYATILGAFGPEIGCALRVGSPPLWAACGPRPAAPCGHRRTSCLCQPPGLICPS